MNLEGLLSTPRESRVGNGRIVGLAFVIFLHVGLVLALLMGLGHQEIEVPQKPLITKIIEAPKQVPPHLNLPPPTPPPTPTLTRVFIPLPELAVKVPPAPKAITAVTTVSPTNSVTPVVTKPTTQVVVRTAPVVDAAHSCPEPEYPAISRRLEESGTVVLRFLIGVDGKVISGQIDHSSGYPRLDKAALEALSLCQFKPGTVDGQPVQSSAILKYIWKLQD